MIRLFDLILSLFGLVILLPFFILIIILILTDSAGSVFYLQIRVGKNDKDFRLIKFRTMRAGADLGRSLTIGARDPRITRIGYFLRRYKLDELPQLINVLKGEMSLVGPRPEVRKYVDLYTPDQRRVLEVKPGITDYASLEFIDENEMLEKAENWEETYIREIMPAKLRLNQKYISDPDIGNYFRIIVKTIAKIFR